VAAFDRNGWPPSVGIGGRFASESAVEAILQVYEGQSHAHYLRDDSAPETKEVFAEISGFFDKHLGK
jgi:hypothetical protein